MKWAAVVLVLLVAIGWGYGQRRTRLRLELQAENAHQAAFHRLVGGVEVLEEALVGLEAVRTERAFREGLLATQARALAAAEAAAAVPLPAQPLAYSGAYLDRVAAVAADYLRRQQAPDPAALQMVAELRRQAGYLRAELLSLADLTGSGRLRWAQAAAVAAPDGDGRGATPINRAMQALEDGWPPATPATAPSPLPSAEDAARCAREFLARAFGDVGAPSALERDAASGLAYFSAATAAGSAVRLAVNGDCHVPYMLADRALGEVRLQPAEATAAALAAARRLGLGDVEPSRYSAIDGVALVSLAPVVAGWAYFDDARTLRIALDSGELLGVAAPPFRPQALPAPRLSLPQARRGVLSGGVPVLRVKRGDVYVFYDAVSGEEVRIERVSE